MSDVASTFPDYVERGEIARRLGVARASIYAMERRGLLPPAIHVTGRICLYPEAAARALIEGRASAEKKADAAAPAEAPAEAAP